MTDTVTVDIEQLAAQIEAGQAWSASQLQALAETRDLIGIGMLATDMRARLHGSRGTFLRVHTVDVAVPIDGLDTGDAGEVRLTGVPASADAAVAAVRQVRAQTTLPISGWSLDELAALGGSLGDTLSALRAAGLDAVTTARLDRLDLAQLEAVKSAGLTVQTVTLGAPVDGVAFLDLLEQLRAWQAATTVVEGCAPLPVETSPDQPTTGYDDMRHVALARLVLDNVSHIQAHWTRMGAKLAQSCLLFGADDLDGVPAHDDMPYGPRRAIVEEVRRNVTAASLTPAERDGRWQVKGEA